MGLSGRIGYIYCIYWTVWARICKFYTSILFGWSSPYKGDSARFSEVASGNPTFTCIPRVDE